MKIYFLMSHWLEVLEVASFKKIVIFSNIKDSPPFKTNAVHAGCQEMNCDKIDSKLFRKACEADIAITGDTSWACADILMNHEAILDMMSSRNQEYEYF